MSYTHAEIREMLEKITKGEWHADNHTESGRKLRGTLIYDSTGMCVAETYGPPSPDSYFIAAAPTIVEQLLKENERMQQEIEKLKK